MHWDCLFELYFTEVFSVETEWLFSLLRDEFSLCLCSLFSILVLLLELVVEWHVKVEGDWISTEFVVDLVYFLKILNIWNYQLLYFIYHLFYFSLSDWFMVLLFVWFRSKRNCHLILLFINNLTSITLIVNLHHS